MQIKQKKTSDNLKNKQLFNNNIKNNNKNRNADFPIFFCLKLETNNLSNFF